MSKKNITNNYSQALVSIIVPCYKQAQYLPDALDSVLAQTYTHWECIVVNDASPDNTTDVANGYVLKDSRIKLLNKPINEGLAAARNSGIAASSGFFILPLDADDMIHSDYLSSTLQLFESNKNLKVAYTDTQCFGERNDIVKKPAMNLPDFCRQNFIHPTALFKRSDYLKTEGYRKNVFAYEDWDMWLQIIKFNNEAQRVPEPLFICRVKSHSMIFELINDLEKEQNIRQNLIKNNMDQYKKYASELVNKKSWPSRIFSKFPNVKSKLIK